MESKKLVDSYHGQIQHLENALSIHTQETVTTDALVSKIKSLHAEHCESLEKEILSWRKSCEDKSKSNSQLKKKMEGLMVKIQNVEVSNNELKSFIKKMEELDNEKKNVISSYEEKLQVRSLCCPISFICFDLIYKNVNTVTTIGIVTILSFFKPFNYLQFCTADFFSCRSMLYVNSPCIFNKIIRYLSICHG